MNSAGALELNGNHYSRADLQSGNFGSNGTPFEIATLNFCQAWLSGTDSFTLTTSGSTGTPKAITLLRSAMEASANATAAALGLREGKTSLICLDTRYIAGKMMIVRSLIKGMTMIAVEPSSNPFALLDASVEIDFTALVPYQLNAILASHTDIGKLNGLRSVLIGGAETDMKTRSLLEKLQPAFYATYGMTETISHIALQKLNPPGEQDYFFVLPGVHIEKDERGCLTIQADYLGKETLITNDVVEILSENEFRWLGRLDNVINTGGVKVMPEKTEKIIAGIFETIGISNRFFIAGVADAQFGNRVCLVIEGNLPSGKQRQIQDVMKERLTRFELPKEIRYVDNFRETATQKIDRKGSLGAG